MRKILPIIIILCISNFFYNVFDNSDYAEAGGPSLVSGSISTDTIWTQGNSPYYIIGNTSLEEETTLIIQKGTTIRFANNTQLTVRGNLYVNGTKDNPVVFTNLDPLYNYSQIYVYDSYRFTYNGSGINYYVNIDSEKGGSASISNAEFNYASHRAILIGLCNDEDRVIISETVFSNNQIGIDGSGGSGVEIRKCTLQGNYYAIQADTTIYDSEFINNTIGISSGSAMCFNSTFSDNNIGIDGPNLIKFSKFQHNDVGIKRNGGGILTPISYNSIVNNIIGVLVTHSGYNPGIKDNNIYNNSFFNLKLSFNDELYVTDNWWGTTNSTLIEQSILDNTFNSTLGDAIYQPFLSSAVNISIQPPVAIAGPEHVFSDNCTITFNGSLSYDPGEVRIIFKWDFGDGSSSDWQDYNIATHSYNLTGNYTVTLIVQNSDGYIGTDEIMVTIIPITLNQSSGINWTDGENETNIESNVNEINDDGINTTIIEDGGSNDSKDIDDSDDVHTPNHSNDDSTLGFVFILILIAISCVVAYGYVKRKRK